MKVLIIAKEDYLGAGKAAYRLYESFKRKGCEVCMLVKNKESNNKDVIHYDQLVRSSIYYRTKQFITSRLFKKKPEKAAIDPNYYFFGIDDLNQHIYVDLIVEKLPFIPEIIIITWTSDFLSPKNVLELQQKTKARIYAYPMDMSLLTGGCHYSWECNGYKKDCSGCPAILDINKKQIASRNLQAKKNYYSMAGLKIVVPSHQLQNQAKESVLFKNQSNYEKVLIPIDEDIYNNKSRKQAREFFNLSIDQKILFFGASFTNEKRKGITLLIEALNLLKLKYNKLQKDTDSIKVLIAGNQPQNQIKEQTFPFNTTYLGYINKNEIFSLAYQASNVFINSSIQDSGPMMVNESIMCGTPIVTFNLGVSEDLVKDGFSGYKVSIGNLEDMANALYDILENNSSVNNDAISLFGLEKTSYKSFQPYNFLKETSGN